MIRYSVALFLFTLLIVNCDQSQENTYTTTGTIEAYTIDIRAATGGELVYTHLPEGRPVSKGDLLAITDTTEFHLRRQQIQTQLAGLPIREASLENKKSQLRIRLQFLEKQYQRLERLAASQGVSQDKVDEIDTEVQVLRRKLDGINYQQDQVRNQEDQLREQLRLLSYHTSRSLTKAPVTGRLLERYVHQGERVQPGHLLATIGVLDSAWTMLYLPEPLLGHISYGTEITIRVDGKKQPRTGTVSWVSSEAEFTPKTVFTEDTRTSLTYAVRVRIPNADGLFKIGMPVVLELTDVLSSQTVQEPM